MSAALKRKRFTRRRVTRGTLIYTAAAFFVVWILFPIWYTLSRLFHKTKRDRRSPDTILAS